MRLFGYEITLRKQATYPAYGYPHQWNQLIAHEPFTGAWQRNMELRGESVLGYPAVYACVTRISSDISKLPLVLVERQPSGIWTETESAAFSPVLREPNHYQSTSQFIEQWLFSKLITGNSYVYKKRDNRGVVVEFHVLDPRTTKPLVADNGEIYYEVARDNLAGLSENTGRLNASDIIHDRMNPMYHPLFGVTPLTAAGMAAIQGLAIQRQSTGFFQNQAAPSGMLTAPSSIDEATAVRLKAHFEQAFTGANVGRVVVGGDGLEWKPFTMTAVDAEVIKQLQMTATQVCACYQVPAFMVGFGETPKYDNIEAQIRLYFSQCLQSLTLSLEGLLDRGLGLNAVKDGVRYGTMFDLDVLFDMDTVTLIKAMGEGVTGGLMKPNEGRRRLNLPPAEGGDQVFLQQQNYSLPALAKRDAKADPFASSAVSAPANDDNDEEPEDDSSESISATRAQSGWIAREMFAA
jgi:HK97 family phage portal protein